ncbi:MAG: hypothetical protein J2P17_16565 [Mycobacterium sp.]|nr:hypothetical protein [Mycobacterium sp.]
MARIRSLKPEFFRSPSTAKVDPYVRIFYQALWCWADDFGIGETNIYGLLGFAFPDSDGFSAEDLRRFCADCARHYGVVFYIVRERHYYAIPNWDQHQKTERRTERRRNPGPDDPDAVHDMQFQVCADSAGFCAGKPAQNPRKNVAGTGEQGNRGTEEPPYPPEPEPAPERLPAKRNGAEVARQRFANLPSRSLDAHRIAEAFSASLPVPIESGLLADIGVQIDKCLHDGIPPPAVAAGLKAWTASDSWSPTQIPRFVHKANNRSRAPTHGKPTAKAVGYDQALEELLQEIQTL